jgi:hypothetical protein
MAIHCRGKAKLLIPETGEVFEVSSDDLNWEIVETDERPMGTEWHYCASVCFSSDEGNYEIEAEWDVWEYPIGSIEHTDTEVRGGKLLQNFENYLPLSLVPEDYSKDQLDAILSNTKFHQTFSQEIFSLKVLNNIKIADNNSQKALKRQIYIAAITCLETYLSDAFINTVLSSKEYLKSFFFSFKDFKEQKLQLNELFNYVERAEGIAKKALLEVSYHNLPRVSKMYETALDIKFPDFSKVQKDIVTRHDLVHRNGKNKVGEEIIVDEVMVNEVIFRIESFVNEIDRNLHSKKHSPESN